MFAVFCTLLVVLAGVLFARSTLAVFSWSRLEKLCGEDHDLKSRIFQNNGDVAAAMRVLFWLLIASLVIFLLLGVLPTEDGNRTVGRFVICWAIF